MYSNFGWARRTQFLARASIIALIAINAHEAAAQATTAHQYDELGRLIETDYGGGDKVEYTYDAAGNRTKVDTFSSTAQITIVDDSTTVVEDSSANSIDVLANDGHAGLTITSVSNPPNGSASIVGGGTAIEYTPDPNFNGNDSFFYVATDPNTNTGQATVSVTVTPVNDAPNAVNDSVSTNEDTNKTFDPRTNDSDPEGSPITITAKTNGSKGTVTILSGGTQLRYTPNTNANGSDSFTYTISDGSLTDTATVSMTINPVNDAPNAVNDSTSTNEDTAKTFDPRVNDTDPDGNTLTVTGKTNGSNGVVAIVGGGTQLQYTPNLNFNGSDSFTYTVSDGSLTDTATVSVTINPVNDPPNAVNDTFYNVNPSQWTTLNVLANDSDLESSVTVDSVINVGAGTAQVISNGAFVQYRWLSPTGTSGTFNYIAHDAQGAADTAVVTVNFSGGGLPEF